MPSTRSIRAPSPMPTATAWAIWRGSPRISTTSRRCKVEAIWLSPIFTSPMADFGYDVSDYCDVDPVFGTLDGPRRADRGLPRARHQARARLGARTTAPTSTRGSSNRDRAATTPSATGTSGATQPNDWVARFQGRRRRRGPTTRPPGSTTCTRSWPSSPTSTGTTPRSWPRCTTCCASGWTAASTACGSTRSTRSPRTRCCATTRTPRAATTRTGRRSTSTCAASAGSIDEYDDRMIVGEVALQDLHRVVGYLESGDQLHLAHNFVFIDQAWDAETYATSIADFEALAEETAWPAWFLANHDNPRPASRFDHDGLGAAAGARDPGDALRAPRHARSSTRARSSGLPDAPIPPERVVDVDGRDPERAPIPWTPERPATASRPASRGCRSSPRPRRSTPQTQAERPALHAEPRARARAPARRQRRRCRPATQRPFDAGTGVLAWTREHEGETLLVAVNFTDRAGAARRGRGRWCSPATRTAKRRAPRSARARRCCCG